VDEEATLGRVSQVSSSDSMSSSSSSSSTSIVSSGSSGNCLIFFLAWMVLARAQQLMASMSSGVTDLDVSEAYLESV
jgi:hypothetical protein